MLLTIAIAAVVVLIVLCALSAAIAYEAGYVNGYNDALYDKTPPAERADLVNTVVLYEGF